MYLNTHTYYSFRYGTLSAEVLLNEMKKKGFDSFALTDINSTSANLNFVRLAPKYGIKPVLGIDFRNGINQKFIGVAQNNAGYNELNVLLSKHLHNNVEFDDFAPELDNAFVIYQFSNFNGERLRENEYLGVSPNDLNKLRFSKWSKYSDKLVMLKSATFMDKRGFSAHRLLRAIDNNTLLSKLNKTEEASTSDILLYKDEFVNLYNQYPEIIRNTENLLSNCNISFEFGQDIPPKNQKTYTGSMEKDIQLIRYLCDKGLEYRYPDTTEEIKKRVNMELDLIQKKGFISYFLINWDIVSYAQQKGYFYVGRGSGANSVVAYLLRITDVDPIEIDLYFERFMNLYRKNPPDFDLDFSWKDRDDVTAYIFNRFPHTALLATYNTFQYKATVRELGKVFGLPKHEIDELSDGKFEMNKLDSLSLLVLKYAKYIQGFPSHLSIHAGGMLISEHPVTNYTATFMPPKGFPTTQIDMVVAEDVGLYKFDILSQRGLGKIKDSIGIIERNQPEAPRIDIHDIKRFKEDEKVKELLRKGRCMGCFYIESPAMRMLLSKLEVDHYLGLVAASSIIRPGVAKSGMMREYILRYRNPERRKEAHPIMLNIMPETYGVMVYQEDVIKVAHYFAGLTLGEADVLRRGMSGKYRSREEFQQVKNRFFEKCYEKGHSKELTSEIWRQTESFAGYAFAKGHSASYAVESYQALFLKAYFPLEYMVAVINNFGGFYRTEHYVHEARMWGANICAPCVNKSEYLTTIYGNDIFLGFIHLSEFEMNVAERLIKGRRKNGVFQDFNDFLDRVNIGIEQLTILIRINAFRFTGKNKRELLWEAHFKLNPEKDLSAQKRLFNPPRKEFVLPQLNLNNYEDAFDQIELLGFSLYDPFMLLEDKRKNSLLAQNLPSYLNKMITIYGYLITIKKTKTVNKKLMYFGTFLDQKGYFFDTTHFPKVAKEYRFKGRGVYAITGKVVEEFGFYSIEVSKMRKMAVIPDPRYND